MTVEPRICPACEEPEVEGKPHDMQCLYERAVLALNDEYKKLHTALALLARARGYIHTCVCYGEESSTDYMERKDLLFRIDETLAKHKEEGHNVR